MARRSSAAPARIAALVAFLVVAIGLLPSPRARALEHPNIVVVVTDDQRDDTLTWMPTVQQQLVGRGTSFRNAVVPTSVCCPSRASILTGLYAHSTGVWSNANFPNLGGWAAFHANGMEERTVATWLDPTYRTILVGKYLNHYDRAPIDYIPPGWNAWHAFKMSNAAYYDYRLLHTNKTLTYHGWAPSDYSTDVLRRHAVNEIVNTPADQPLFLYFAPYAPHGPSTPAPRHATLDPDLPKYRPPNFNERDRSDKPPWIQALDRVDPVATELRRLDQYRTLRSVDEAVGAIVDALRSTRRIGNTLFLFISDNGGSWGEHRIDHGQKFMPYAAATRIPLVMRWDGHVTAGRNDARLALNLDIAATIAQAAGVTPPPLGGRSLLKPATRGGTVMEAASNIGKSGNGLSIPRPAYCGFLNSRYLYVRYAGGFQELYDYQVDPYELRNVAKSSAYGPVLQDMRAKAKAACVPTPPEYSW